MTLKELGQDIRKKREETGLTIQDVAARIKVSSRTLQAIETGTQEHLPHAVYTKGFVRSYALLIGFDCAELNERLEEIFPPEVLDNSKQEFGPMVRTSGSSGTGRKFFILLLLFVLLAGIGAGGWYIFKTYGDTIVDFVKQSFSAVTTPAVSEPGVSATLDAAAPPEAVLSDHGTSKDGTSGKSEASFVSTLFSGQVKNVPIEAQSSEALAGGPDNTASPPGAAGIQESAPVESSSVSGASATTASSNNGALLPPAGSEAVVPLASETVPTPSGKKFLTVVIEQTCWVGFRTDGARAREITLYPGQMWVFPFSASLELTLGNAAAATLYYDGKKHADLGRKGEVVIIRLP